MNVLIYLVRPDIGEYPKPDPKGYTPEYTKATADYATRYAFAADDLYRAFITVYKDIDVKSHILGGPIVAEMSEAIYQDMHNDRSGFIERVYLADPRPPVFDANAHKPVTYYEITYHDYGQMVLKFIGADPTKYEYNVVSDMEWGNDQDHSFVADGNVDITTLDGLEEKYKLPELTEEDEANLARYEWHRKDISLPSPGEMLNLMVAHGAMPAGNYLITVSW